MTVSSQELRAVMGQFATGVTVVLTQADGRVLGMTANAFTSVALDPPLILLCVGHDRVLHGAVEASGQFTVSILDEAGEPLARHFAGQDVGLNADSINFIHPEGVGAPVLGDAIAWLACAVTARHVGGDHSIFVAQVQACQVNGGRPLLFFGGRFRGLG